MQEKKVSKKMWKIGLYIGSLSIGVIAAASASAYFIVKALSTDNQRNESSIFSDTRIDEILRANVKKRYANFKPSEFLSAPNGIENYLDFSLEPNGNLENLESKFALNYEIIPNTVDDYSGTMQILVTGIDKLSKNNTVPQQHVITVGGFRKAISLTSAESIWFTNELDKIKTLSFKEEFSNLTRANFWDLINLPESIESFKNFYTTKEGKNNRLYSFDVEIENIDENAYAVELSLGFSAIPSKRVTKIFLVNTNFNNPEWKQQLDSDFTSNVLPGNLSIMPTAMLKKYFLSNPNDSARIEVIKKTMNNNNGTVYLKRTARNGKISYGFYNLLSYRKLFNKVLNTDNKIKNFLNQDLNISNNRKDVIFQYNKSDGFNFRYSRLLFYIHQNLKYRDEYFKNVLKLGDSMKLFDLTNFEETNNGNDLILDFINVSGQNYSLHLPLDINKIVNNPDLNSKRLLPKTIEEVTKEIQSRTLSISFYEKRNIEGSERTFVTSGTAWIIDKSKTEKNTYFLATNIHVIEKMESNWENIDAFQYSIVNDTDDLFNSRDIFGRRTDNFRIIPRPEKNNFSVSFVKDALEYAYFWNNLKIYNIGANAIEKNVSADVAIIKITFPDDKVDSHGITIQKNIPDAARYYDEKQQNKSTRLKFFTSNYIKWNEEDKNNSFSGDADIRNSILPMDLTLGGYLGGKEWVSNTSSGFIYYSKANKKTKIPYYENYENSNKKRQNINSTRSPYQIVLPISRAGKGMSGSMVMDRYGRVVGIFWGGSFGGIENEDNHGLEKGIANLETLGISINNNESILQRWLNMTTDLETDLDDITEEINEAKS